MLTPTIYLIIFAFLCQLVSSIETPLNSNRPEDATSANTKPSVICVPFGNCEPCPEEALAQPFCKPFGNRRLLHCSNNTNTSPRSLNDFANARFKHGHEQNSHHDNQRAPPPPHFTQRPDSQGSTAPPDAEAGAGNIEQTQVQGETPAWESCGRIPEVERADFFEFFACNVLFALGSLGLVLVRQRRQRGIQNRQLAARIGSIGS